MNKKKSTPPTPLRLLLDFLPLGGIQFQLFQVICLVFTSRSLNNILLLPVVNISILGITCWHSTVDGRDLVLFHAHCFLTTDRKSVLPFFCISVIYHDHEMLFVDDSITVFSLRFSLRKSINSLAFCFTSFLWIYTNSIPNSSSVVWICSPDIQMRQVLCQFHFLNKISLEEPSDGARLWTVCSWSLLQGCGLGVTLYHYPLLVSLVSSIPCFCFIVFIFFFI